MSDSTLPIIVLNWRAPPDAVIDGELLSAQWQREIEQQQNEQQQKAIIGSARRKAETLLRQIDKKEQALREAMQQEYAALTRSITEQCEAAWIEAHVKQLVATQQAEQALIEQVADRILNSIAIVLRTWCAEQSIEKTLLARVSEQVQRLAQQGALTLHIHPDHLPQASSQWGDSLTIVADAELADDQVRIVSSLMSVELSLSRHFEALLTWLRGSQEEREDEHD